MFPSDDARWVRSTGLVSDEFVVNAGVLVAYYTKNMLDEYVDRDCDVLRRRRVNKSMPWKPVLGGRCTSSAIDCVDAKNFLINPDEPVT